MLVLCELRPVGNLHVSLLKMASKAELSCVYAALILVDDDVAVTVSVRSILHIFTPIILG